MRAKTCQPGPGEFGLDRNPDHTFIAAPFGKLACKVTTLPFVHADHRTIRAAFGKQPALGREIPTHACVAIQMIRREVGENRDVRCQCPRQISLIARQFKHHDTPVLRRVQIEHAAPDVAGKFRRPARLEQDVVHEGRCRRLAVGPGDRNDARWHVVVLPARGREGLEKEPDVIVHRHPGDERERHHRIGGGIEMRNARAHDQPRDIIEIAGVAERLAGEAFGLGLLAGGGAVIPTQGLGAPGP